LHRECWSAWRKMRPFQAKEALTRMGIRNVSDGGIVTGECGRAPATVKGQSMTEEIDVEHNAIRKEAGLQLEQTIRRGAPGED
jgi:hypothetical protein